MKTPVLAPIFSACLSLAATGASAQVLMLDFGPTAVTNTDRLNSPYHTANNSFTGTTWNTVGVADPSSVVFSNNTASGASVNLGTTTTNTVNLTSQPGSSSALGIATNTGVYGGTSVGTDGIFSGTGTSNLTLGLQVGGLTAGTYDIYVVARNTNTGSEANKGYSQTVFAGKSSSSGNFDFSGYASGTLTYPNDAATALYTSAWVQGENYVKLSVTLSAGEFLNLAVDGTAIGTSGDTRGFLNAVQIVNTSAVPEPSTYALLGGFAALGLAALRRRR